MKRIISVLLLLLSLFQVTAFAAEENDISKFELPAPKAPNYFIYTDGNASEAQHDDLRMIMVADPQVTLLSAEYDRDSDAFYEKYGLYSFEIVMQYDVSLDIEDKWQYTGEWTAAPTGLPVGVSFLCNCVLLRGETSFLNKQCSAI